MGAGDGPELVGRESELARLRAFVSALEDGPRVFALRGGPGIGKTTLWRSTVESAVTAGHTVLSASCAEAELPLALAGLSDLVRELLPTLARDLAEHEWKALATASGLELPGEAVADQLTLPRAFLSMLSVLASRSRVLVAVDDVQWLDPASARILGFALRRLRDLRVGVLVSERTGITRPELLAGGQSTPVEELVLGPLSLGALAHLVRARFDVRIPRPALARVHEASGGNPMFALEFTRAALAQRHPLLGPVPVPPSLHELVRARVERYSDATRLLLAAVAGSERPTVALLERFHPDFVTALDSAMDDGAVVVGHDGVLRLGHPLIGSAAYGDLGAAERRRLHARLAGLVAEQEERSRHLALATVGPDDEVSGSLVEAAARARARGAPDAAIVLAQEAVRLTPEDSTDILPRVLVVAEYLAAAGRTSEALPWLDRLLTAEVPAPLRARARVLRTGLEHDLEAAQAELADLLEEAGEDLQLRSQVLLRSSSYLAYRDDLVASEARAREALAAAEEAGDHGLVAIALARIADRAHGLGRPQPHLLDRAVEMADLHGTPQPFVSPRCTLGEVLLREGELDMARDALETELASAERSADAPLRGRILFLLSDVEERAGHWDVAERHVQAAWALVLDAGGDLWEEGELLHRHARLAALRGDVAGTWALVAEVATHAALMNWPLLADMNRWVSGHLHLSLGDPAQAWQSLESVARVVPYGRPEVLEPLGDGIEALVALGRASEAAELQMRLEGEAARGHRWAPALALRCGALLLLSRDDSGAALAAAEEAGRRFQAAGFPLDAGRARLVAADAHRRLGERRLAAEHLEAAGGLFADLGATLWAARAERELRRARPRPRSRSELTSAERRVAAEVVTGKTNREIASALFTTVATVEAHLTRVYRKLGLRSRTELTRQVADGTVSLADD